MLSIFRAPVFEPAPANDVLMLQIEPSVMAEYQKLNPETGKFNFRFEIFGLEQMKERTNAVGVVYENSLKTIEDQKRKVKEIRDKYQTNLKERILVIHRRNNVILQKLISINGIVEQIATERNLVNRKTNEEMRIYNKLKSVESLPNELTSKILDIRMLNEELPVRNLSKKFDDISLRSRNIDETRTNVLSMLNTLKEGISCLQQLNEMNTKVFMFFFSSRRRHTRQESVSWARRCVQETAATQYMWHGQGIDTKMVMQYEQGMQINICAFKKYTKSSNFDQKSSSRLRY
eukprot:TRINITY_DN12172_c0_g1_i1.p1 TRINITY_DN12172_c0_g1~~TRINITY_DN12172_c0_g1_i1.p1  ORF type:complete len:290 (+),score=87.76 TRINITY_DN12172_c0_g1_i1:186-1055(+)